MYLANGIIAPANATPQVCVLQPVDFSIDPNLVILVNSTLAKENPKYIPIVQELTDKSNKGCSIVIQIERIYNTNDRYADKSVHYIITGNVIHLFAYKTPVANARLSPTSHVMSNFACLLEAYGTFHQNLGDKTSMTFCDPYRESNHITNQVPNYVIVKSLTTAMEKFGL
ncbi:MAG TPA: hypothetical protein VGR54_04110 [Nitrosopumilaceae archaeon]|nr:hypothetical protein [Nitrosopumilaceae archaeon]